MNPNFSIYNLRTLGKANIKHFCYYSSGIITFSKFIAHCYNNFISKFRISVLFTSCCFFWMCVSSVIFSSCGFFWMNFKIWNKIPSFHSLGMFSSVRLSMFFISINNIIYCSSQEKMFWITTGRIITGMANHFIYRVNIIMKKICNTMRFELFKFPFCDSYAKCSITVAKTRFWFPIPTFIEFTNINPRPKSIYINFI